MMSRAAQIARRVNEANMKDSLQFSDKSGPVGSAIKCRANETLFKPDESVQGDRVTNEVFIEVAVPIGTVVKGHYRCTITFESGYVASDLFVHSLPVPASNQSQWTFLVKMKKP